MSNLLTPDVLGAASSLTNYNGNLDLIENSLGASGPYVVSGLVPSIGTGLSVNVTAGTALVAGLVTVSAGFAIGGLAPSTTNHLFVKQDGTGTSNTSGSPPALSTKIGTATTSGSAVTSVNVLRSSGRQTLVRPENQVPGDPGSMGSLDFNDWNATAGDGFTFFGTIPAGAMPTSFTAPLTLTADDANQSSVTRVLTLKHTYNAGNGANGIGAGIEFQAENTAGGNNVLGRIDWKTINDVSANFTSQMDLRLASNNTDVLAMTVAATGDLTLASGGVFNGAQALLSGGVRGNNTALSFGTSTITFPSDADYTLSAAEMATAHLIIAAGTITAARNLIVPATVGGFYTVLNNNTQTVTVKTAAGTGIAILNGQTSLLRVGANVIELVNSGFSTGSLGGDVTGSAGANTVTKIRGRAITQPGASEDTWVPRYNHAGTNLVWSKASSIATLGVWGTTDVSALTTGDVEQPNAWTPGNTNHPVQIPDSGTLEWLSVVTSADVGTAGNSISITVYKNGVATALTATLNGGAGTEIKVLAGTTVTVSQADMITIQAKRTGTPAAVIGVYTVHWSCKI